MQKKKPLWRVPVLLFFVFSILGCASAEHGTVDPAVIQAQSKLVISKTENRMNSKPLLMVHYMPWFEAPTQQNPKKGYGFHWHMGGAVFDPYETREDGKQNIASHYYPLTGPYDSQDPDVIEYQVLLMKLAGIDGVIVDWYGIDDALDYKSVHESCKKLFVAVKRAGLQFAVCYEDQSLGKMVEAAKLKPLETVDTAKKTLIWLDQNWFSDSAYLKFDGRPVLLNFGPQYLETPDDWNEAFSALKTRPYFVTLDAHMESYADSIFPWPPMWMAPGRELSLDKVVSNLNQFYQKVQQTKHIVTTAYPRFHDIYHEAKAHDSYGTLKDYGGGTLQLTLEAALASKPDVIQIATWNDYGEGTVVEPNDVYGYRDLRIIQNTRKSFDPDFPFSAEYLSVPLEIFHLRRTGQHSESIEQIVRSIFNKDKAGFEEAVTKSGIHFQKVGSR